MGNRRAIHLDPSHAGLHRERSEPPADAIHLMRQRLLDPGLDAHGVLALTDAILALQHAETRS